MSLCVSDRRQHANSVLLEGLKVASLH